MKWILENVESRHGAITKSMNIQCFQFPLHIMNDGQSKCHLLSQWFGGRRVRGIDQRGCQITSRVHQHWTEIFHQKDRSPRDLRTQIFENQFNVYISGVGIDDIVLCEGLVVIGERNLILLHFGISPWFNERESLAIRRCPKFTLKSCFQYWDLVRWRYVCIFCFDAAKLAFDGQFHADSACLWVAIWYWKCGLCTMRGIPFSRKSCGDVECSWCTVDMCNSTFHSLAENLLWKRVYWKFESSISSVLVLTLPQPQHTRLTKFNGCFQSLGNWCTTLSLRRNVYSEFDNLFGPGGLHCNALLTACLNRLFRLHWLLLMRFFGILVQTEI